MNACMHAGYRIIGFSFSSDLLAGVLGLLVGLTEMAGRLRSAEDPGLKWIPMGRRGQHRRSL